MKVYIVERCYDYEGCNIERVFSTRELAEADAKAINIENGYGPEGNGPLVVTEWEVDEPSRITTSAPPKEKP